MLAGLRGRISFLTEILAIISCAIARLFPAQIPDPAVGLTTKLSNAQEIRVVEGLRVFQVAVLILIGFGKGANKLRSMSKRETRLTI